TTEIQSQSWRVTCSPHHNHQDNAAQEVATQLWMDWHLKKGGQPVPASPTCKVQINTASGIPSVFVHADESQPVLSVDVFYTRHGKQPGEPEDRENTIARFWHHAALVKEDNHYRGELPLHGIDQPLWVYANVTYRLPQPIEGAGYYYRTYEADRFCLSSLLTQITPQELRKSSVRSTRPTTTSLEDFQGDWRKEWFTYRPDEWSITTHKVYDDVYAAPPDARLQLDVQCELPNDLVIRLDDYASCVKLEGGKSHQTIRVTPHDFKNHAGESLADWRGIKQLKLVTSDRLKPFRGNPAKPRTIGEPWQGPPPEFRSLRWIPTGDPVSE
ncbi:MAG: hypothetical protein AAFV88_18970, partial [Planctomycetota bacterium]